MEHCLQAFRGVVVRYPQNYINMNESVMVWFFVNMIFNFYNMIFSAIDDLMENSEEEAIYLLQSFCEKMQLKVQNEYFLDSVSAEALARISNHLQGIINKATSDIAHWDVSCQIDEGKLALLWGAVNCYSHMSVFKANPSLLLNLVNAAGQLVKVKPGTISILYSLQFTSSMNNFIEPCAVNYIDQKAKIWCLLL